MGFEQLKEQVCQANLSLVEAGLVILTWGNASGIDRKERVVAIKPSGVAYKALRPEHIVLVSLETGEVLEGSKARPSSDTPTHLKLYQEFEEIGGVIHTHSSYATSFAQAMREIPCYGTTHADHFYGAIPVTRFMYADEIESDYELNTGGVIVDRFKGKLDPSNIPGVLVAGHGPFAWGKTIDAAVENAIVIEEVAKMAIHTSVLNSSIGPIPQVLLNKHFLRKHGPQAYYGQK